MIHAQIEKHLNSDFDTITLIDRFDNNNIIGVIKIRNVIVRGFDQAFFYIPIDHEGMIYFESFCIIKECEGGSRVEVVKECKPKSI